MLWQLICLITQRVASRLRLLWLLWVENRVDLIYLLVHYQEVFAQFYNVAIDYLEYVWYHSLIGLESYVRIYCV